MSEQLDDFTQAVADQLAIYLRESCPVLYARLTGQELYAIAAELNVAAIEYAERIAKNRKKILPFKTPDYSTAKMWEKEVDRASSTIDRHRKRKGERLALLAKAERLRAK